jgi:hypothetical protein
MTIRQLRQGEPVPVGTPKRYQNAAGYTRLRWRLSDGNHVEVYEHRLVADALNGEHVHHRNGVKSDNRPENLEVLSPSAHGHAHQEVVDSEVERLYLSGLSIPEIKQLTGWDTGVLSRSLKRSGVTVIMGERQRLKLDEAQILEWYHRGIRVARMAKWLGIDCGPITRLLKRKGLARFPIGTPRRGEEA